MPKLDTFFSFTDAIMNVSSLTLNDNCSEYVKLIDLNSINKAIALKRINPFLDENINFFDRISYRVRKRLYLKLTLEFDKTNKITDLKWVITIRRNQSAYYLPVSEFERMAHYWATPTELANNLAVFGEKSISTLMHIILVKCKLNGNPSSFTLDQLTFPMGGGGPDPNHTGTRLP